MQKCYLLMFESFPICRLPAEDQCIKDPDDPVFYILYFQHLHNGYSFSDCHRALTENVF